MELIGKSGSMMAAVFETAGYIYQDHVLTQLKSAFEGSLGGFVFLIGVVVAIFAVVIRGGFKLAPWLLIGPPMFFAVILPRTSINEAQWKFGQQDRNQGRVTRRVQDVVGQSANNVQVSKLFARYVFLVSETVQEVSRRINTIGNAEDRLLIFRGDMLGFLYSGQIEDRDFFFFLHDAFFGQCKRYIYAASIIADDQFTLTERSGAERLIGGNLNNFRTDPTVTLRGRSLAFYQDRMGNVGTTYNEIARERERLTSNVFTCEQIWRLTEAGLLEYAGRRVEDIRRRADAGEIPQAQLLQNIQQAIFGGNPQPTPGQEAQFNQAAVQRLTRVAAAYMLRNEYLEQTNIPAMMNAAGNSGWTASTEVIDHDNFYQTERARVASLEFSEKTRLMTAAENLPYYQGLGLFFLGYTFPFFAMLLLIPGKHPGFLLWFVLWLWLKSWDVGIAVVAMLDKLLFTVLGYHQEVRNQSPELKTAFEGAMVALMNMDPTFQMSTYYNILGVSLMSIPVISSQLILGALTGGAGLIAAGMNQTAQTVSGGVQVSQQQTAVGELRFRYHDERKARMDANVDMLFGRLPSSQDQRARYAAGSPEYRQDTLRYGSDGADLIAAQPAANRAGFRRDLSNGTRTIPFSMPDGRTLQRRAGGVAYPIGVQNRAFLDTNRLNQTMRTLDGMSQSIAGLRRQASVLGELSNPTSQLAWQRGNPIYEQLTGVFRTFSGGANYQMTLLEQQFREQMVSGDVLLAWTQFNLNYSADNQGHAGRARVWGMLEVPWTMAAGTVQDDQYDQQLRSDHVARQSATITAMAEIIRSAQSNPANPQAARLLTREGFRSYVAGHLRGEHRLTPDQQRDIEAMLNDNAFMNRLFPREGAVAPADRGPGRLPAATLRLFMRSQEGANP